MTRCLYGLLVGIDEYPAPVPCLDGCVNDITAFETFLRGRSAGDRFELKLLKLVDQSATRAGVIRGFLDHLGQAGDQDIALFYYGGHGSQERTPEAFRDVEPDGLDETLVCYDSRTAGNHDLADKELAALIAHIAQRNPHILVVLDCCHSGSGTRAPSGTSGAKVRHLPTDLRPRAHDSFFASRDALPGSLAGPGGSHNRWLLLPRGRHIVMSACRDDEEAKETVENGVAHGVFSACLLDSLQGASDAPTYRDIFKRANALARVKAARQSPLIEATDASDLDRPFLGGAIEPHLPYFTASYDKTEGWVIDGGAVHGIRPATRGETTTLALFPLSSSLADLGRIEQSIGEAQVIEVGPTRSRLEIRLAQGTPDPNTTYRALITVLPLAELSVEIAGDPVAAALARQALSGAGSPRGSSLVREVPIQGDFRLTALPTGYRIRRAADDHALAIDVQGADRDGAEQAIARLEHIARWTRVARLGNPATRLPTNAVGLQLHAIDPDGGERLLELPADGQPLRFAYYNAFGEKVAPVLRIRLVNQSTQRLYCMLLDLPQTYSVFSGLLEGNGAWLDPGQSVWARVGGDERIPLVIPQALSDQGFTELSETLKVVASTEECDATLLDQGDLDVRLVATRGSRIANRNTLDSLMARVQNRHVGYGHASEALADWTTSEIGLTVLRPRDGVTVPVAGKRVELAPKVVLHGHAGLRATARLGSAATASRNPDLPSMPPSPPWLIDDPDLVRPFEFTASRGGEAGLSVLELDNVDADSAATVCAASPLTLQVGLPLGDDEHILPLSADSEFYLPLGCGRRGTNGIEVTIERLPKPVCNARSLTGSIRIFFKKVVSERLDTNYSYPLLAAVSADAQGRTHYSFEAAAVRDAVQRARSVLLYIHGIVGDTQSMTASAFRPAQGLDSSIPLMHSRYDLILAFDYENLSTQIAQTARDLKQRLADVGLQAGHDKQLDIIAHSMGGLVARWFIEREQGNRVVRHLVMLGTPNGGSPWPAIEEWVTLLIAIGLNGLARLPWPPTVLGSLMKILTRAAGVAAKHEEEIEVTLREMNPESPFVAEIARSADPGVRYSIIAGNTSLIEQALQAQHAAEGRLQRLLLCLRAHNALHEAASRAFFGKPNDIVASVGAIVAIPRGRTPAPVVTEVATDHVSYLENEPGLRALAAALE